MADHFACLCMPQLSNLQWVEVLRARACRSAWKHLTLLVNSQGEAYARYNAIHRLDDEVDNLRSQWNQWSWPSAETAVCLKHNAPPLSAAEAKAAVAWLRRCLAKCCEVLCCIGWGQQQRGSRNKSDMRHRQLERHYSEPGVIAPRALKAFLSGACPAFSVLLCSSTAVQACCSRPPLENKSSRPCSELDVLRQLPQS